MIKKTPVVLCLAFLLGSCGVVHLNFDTSKINNCSERAIQCDECFVVLTPGTCRDQRFGYYFDPVERKCKLVQYSSGGTPPPFKSMEECETCCCY